MPSSLYLTARRAWFEKQPSMSFKLHPQRDLVNITYDDMMTYGGPREFTNCPYCTAAEWYTRITRKNQWLDHPCLFPDTYQYMKKRCAGVTKLEWRHMLRNFNFTLCHDKGMPGLRCLFVVAKKALLIDHGANPGFMMWRKRLAPYQLTICAFTEIGKYNLRDYDFIVMPVHGKTPLIQQEGNPPVFLYGHDHHPPALQARVKELMRHKPAALLTPYPTIWTNAFSIPKETEVIFTPYLSDLFWSAMDANFGKREFDVMVIGTPGPLYPERVAIYDMLKTRKVPFKLKTWPAANPAPQLEAKNASQYNVPTLGTWSKHLSRARICVFGQDKFGYLVNKYSEVAGATSLMVAPNIPDCKRAGLIPNTHFIPIARPVQTALIPQLTDLVRNFSKYAPVALTALDWFKTTAPRLIYNDFWKSVDRVVRESKHAAAH